MTYPLPPGFQLPPGVTLPAEYQPTSGYQAPGYPPVPPGQLPPPVPAAAPRRGWWRRNWWALLVLVPLVGLTIGPDIPDVRSRWTGRNPTEPVSAGSGQWLAYGGGRLRLVTLERVRGLKDYDGRPFTLPATLQVWQATVEVDGADDMPLVACRFLLADVRGRTYEANPSEVRGADLHSPSCLRPYNGPKKGPFTTVATFVTPGSRPDGVRVTVVSELPRYGWFPAPG
jgi:hypothetical protein